ncbi:LpqB family beta-propeller domain-containing protein [Catellatospora sichuanensis]|uniref:LpqB family beta-propeller domain-containing protein n=1 Tax=Catellatospora sichuanensis TaxID=1969805 RepID=UPI0016435ADC|nr:LpqB family beta-propeller domain-containing protein [Catellatospora sichuanensis]
MKERTERARTGTSWLAGVLVAGFAAAALAGCGIGVDSGVVRDGAGPTAAPGQAPPGSSGPQARDADEQKPSKLVKDFLESAAGDHGLPATHENIMDNVVRSYLGPATREEWKPSGDGDLTLVQLIEDPTEVSSQHIVRVRVRYLGVLTVDGRINPHEGGEKTLTFKVEQIGQQGLFITDLPADLLLSRSGLLGYYDQVQIYFWNKDGTSLVPDLRYIPKALEQRENRLLDWLLKGPADWLSPAVRPLPEGTRRLNNIVKDDQKLVVSLAGVADMAEVAVRDSLAAQLYWTLLPKGQLELKVESRVYPTSGNFTAANRAVGTGEIRDPGRYAVDRDAGVLRRISSPEERGALPLHTESNKNVKSAGVAAREAAFALVRQEKGRDRLYVGRKESELHPVDIAIDGAPLGMPFWLDRSAEVVLVLGKGSLWAARIDDRKAVKVGSGGKPITAASVAPDGRRIAFVSRNKLYIAPLLRQANAVGTFAIGQARELHTSLTELRGVGFLREDTLVVASAGSKIQLAHVSVDGVVEEVLTTNVKAEVSNLVGYVPDARRPERTGNVLLDVDGEAHQAFEGALLAPLSAGLILPPAPEPTVTPSPAVSGSPQPAPEVIASAACYEG